MRIIDEKILSTLIDGDINIKQVEPHIYSVFPEGEHRNIYDKGTSFYDLVIANRCYNRIMWGYSIKEFASFCHDKLVSSSEGWVLDVGCGSLVFTAGTYANYTERSVILSDESIQMLRAAKSRLIKLNGSIPNNLVFLHADALKLPFRTGCFKTIIAMNILHVLKDMRTVLQELERIKDENGTVSFTTLVLNRMFGNWYLRLLGRSGQVVPRTPGQLLATFDEQRMPAKYYCKGNMMFIDLN